MTQAIRRYGWRGLSLFVLAGAVAAVLPLLAERAPAREVVLVARGMTFRLDRDPTVANPVLRFSAGERVRLVLRNDTPGIGHDLAVPAWNVGMDLVATGESGALTFTVPDRAGTFAYECRPHAQMMRGTIEVVAR